MQRNAASSHIPRQIWTLFALYCAASFVHFSHNAEYIAFYPNMPTWLTREKVYLAWLAVTSVGLAGVALSIVGWRIAAAVCFVAYGTLGLYGLGHYALALCSEHTLAMNLSIWFEVVAGGMLAICSAWVLQQQVFSGRRSNGV